MFELHEVNLKTFKDEIIRTVEDHRIDGEIFFKNLSHSKVFYYYVVKIYNANYRNNDHYSNIYCEICGNNFRELMNFDPDNEPSWSARTYGNKDICINCAKPLIPYMRIESSKDHKEGCCCHSCIIAIELGYKKKNSEWIKLR